ncbi:eukaryotic translation initiation factor 3 subunit J [Kockovaella imperatae]|uniref:Eukaryotic translation initiation factor 3 subunit J n=1 Tax=Kockovaella imperatae TaxID=4999 RepID=A0A1Y1UM54_9TREE|nr:eukaryotic translation initiation factor 3 subunit J [Kockovaella imperatae]ORX38607.1 eukaryotic translation initiation factor 3 subunit J [Kockovaella imperatae]
MSDDWDIDEEPVKSGSSTPAPAAVAPKVVAKTKWQGEDEDDEEDDWDASEDEKPKASAPTTAAAPVKKKMTLKQKLAEKERLANSPKVNGDDDLIDTTTEQDRRRMARERELAADMAVAEDLMGGASIEDTKEMLQKILTSNPSSKDEFVELSQQIMTLILSRHASNPLYPIFAEQFAKDFCEPLTAVQIRKVGSGLSTLSNTKQQEERDKANGKKKPTSKPKLGVVKSIAKVDTDAYDDVLDDDDFM